MKLVDPQIDSQLAMYDLTMDCIQDIFRVLAHTKCPIVSVQEQRMGRATLVCIELNGDDVSFLIRREPQRLYIETTRVTPYWTCVITEISTAADLEFFNRHLLYQTPPTKMSPHIMKLVAPLLGNMGLFKSTFLAFQQAWPSAEFQGWNTPDRASIYFPGSRRVLNFGLCTWGNRTTGSLRIKGVRITLAQYAPLGKGSLPFLIRGPIWIHGHADIPEALRRLRPFLPN